MNSPRGCSRRFNRWHEKAREWEQLLVVAIVGNIGNGDRGVNNVGGGK
jgi:hypothetical protein